MPDDPKQKFWSEALDGALAAVPLAVPCPALSERFGGSGR